MKKILLAFLVAITPLAFSVAQQTSAASLSDGNFSCSTSCFFESCWVNCKLGGNAYAVCWCWWGFAYCECKEYGGASVASTNHGLTQTEAQRASLLAFQQELVDRGYSQLASIALRIQQAIDNYEVVNTLITEFGEIADALPQSDQEIIRNYIGEVRGEQPINSKR